MYYRIFLNKLGNEDLLGRYQTENPVSKDELISLIDTTKPHNGPTKEDVFYKVKTVCRTIFQEKDAVGPFFRDCADISLIVEEITVEEIKKITTLDY